MKLLILTLSTLLALISCENTAPKDLYMTGSVIKYYGHYYNSLKLFMGSGESSIKFPVWMSIMIGRNNTIIGDSDLVGWGLKCPKDKPDEATSCQSSGVSPLLSIINIRRFALVWREGSLILIYLDSGVSREYNTIHII